MSGQSASGCGASGYGALHEAAAWFDLSKRGRIGATGADRQSFLHNISSNAVDELTAGQGTRAFFLDAQGHILADACLYFETDHVLLDTEPETRASLIEHLEKFIIMDDVTVEDRSGALAELALEGPLAGEVVSQIVPRVPTEDYDHVAADGVRVIRHSFTGQPGFRFVVGVEQKDHWTGRFEQAGAAIGVVAATAEDCLAVRVENQVARHGDDFFTTSLPHETQRLDRISFTKGCYLGQEIVERVRSRGQVNRVLVGIEIEGEEPPDTGADVLLAGKRVGALSSPVRSRKLGCVVAFAILRREAAEPGTTIEVAGLAGSIRAGIVRAAP